MLMRRHQNPEWLDHTGQGEVVRDKRIGCVLKVLCTTGCYRVCCYKTQFLEQVTWSSLLVKLSVDTKCWTVMGERRKRG